MPTQTVKPIAVIGMACRYPGARNLVELWENVLARRQQFRAIPDGRLPLSEYYDPDPATPDKTYGRKAAVIDGFEFDPSTYRIPKSTFAATDIVHWLALTTALEAIKNAKLDLSNLPRDTAGVIVGNTLTGEETRTGTMRLRWPFVRKVLRRAADARGLSREATTEIETTMEEIYKSVFPPVSEDTLAGGLANTIAGRICNFLDFHGGGFTVDGACSSSLLSIATAADYLQQDKMDLAIAGGVDISLDTFELIGFSKATALTRDEMRVYDKRGSGFIPGEGCGMVVLKRLDDARRDGDTVYAVLRGWGVSSDGRGGITAPNAKGQARALIRAYELAGYSPQTLNFVEGHGTGTTVGDRTELEGIAGAVAAYGPVDDHAIGVTSFKSIYGHTKAAAGIGGFIKTVLAVNRRIVPPTAGCAEPHASFGEVARGLYPVQDGAVHTADEQLRAGVSAMGFGGINCHVTVEGGDPPVAEFAPQLSERSLLASCQQSEVIPIAADRLGDLIDAVKALQKDAQGLSAAELVDLAAQCARNVHHQRMRAAVIARSIDELDQRLTALQQRLEQNPPAAGGLWRGDGIWVGNAVQARRVGFLFPGQGSQQIGMARRLVERFDWARSLVEKADAGVASLSKTGAEALSQMFLRDTQRDPAKSREPQWQETLTRTENAQPAICVASMLWNQRLQALGIVPQLVSGHSLGELTALAVAGAYDPETLIRIAAARGRAMATATPEPGLMAMLGCDADTANAILRRAAGGYCTIANINSPQQTIISGERDAVLQAVELATGDGLRAQLLPVSNAFHSRLVASAADRLKQSGLIPARPARLDCRVVSSTDGQELQRDLDLPAHLAAQIVSPVNFTRAVTALAAHCDWLVEVGPGRVLSGLIQSHDANATPPCLPVESKPGRDADFNAVVAEAFTRGLDLHWANLYDQRLVRAFVPAAKRTFYVNPCERELATPPVSALLPERLFDYSESMHAVPKLSDLSEMLTEVLHDTVHAESVQLLLYDETADALRVILPADTRVQRLPADAGIFGDVLRSGAAEAIETLSEDPRFAPDWEDFGIESDWTALYVPLPATQSGLPFGAIRLARCPGAPFSLRDAEIVSELAVRAAPSLIKAYLNERHLELLRIEHALPEVAGYRHDEPEPNNLLANMVETAKAVLGAEGGTLLLYDRDAHELYYPFAIAGLVPDRVRVQAPIKPRFSADCGIAGHVFRTRQPIHTANAQVETHFDAACDGIAGTKTRTIDCIPMLGRTGEAVGVLLLVNRRFPGNRDSLAEMGRCAGALVAHQPLFDQLRATADSLAGSVSTTKPVTAVVIPLRDSRRLSPAAPAASAVPESPRSVLYALISDMTGFSSDTFHDGTRLIDDLNLDSIKIGTLLADVAIKLGVPGKVDPLRLDNADLGTVLAAFGDGAETAPQAPVALDLLFDLVIERTGYGRECLSPDLRLLDDLNIDSIKAASLLGDLFLRTGTQQRIEASALANATLGEIAARVTALQDSASLSENPTPPQPVIPARWVRAFQHVRLPSPPNGSDTSAPADLKPLIIATAGTDPLANQLAARYGSPCLAGSDLTGAPLPSAFDTLLIVLSDRMAAADAGVTDVEQLAVLHRLSLQIPALWQTLRTVAFIQRTGSGPSARAFGASLQLERPALEIAVMEFDPDLTADFAVDRIREELSGRSGYRAVEYDGDGSRWTRCMQTVEAEDCVPRSVTWSPDDVLLVTGGGKGITAECALAFARETGAKLAVLGRSKIPAPDAHDELAATLRRLREAGIEHRYYEVDVADRAALARTVAIATEELGPITGVLHGAGLNLPRHVESVSAAEAQIEIAPKLSGAAHLAALFADVPLKLFAAFTSIIGVTGMRNNAWYAYSNEAVARLLDDYAAVHPNVAVVSYAFGVWDEVGMGVKLGSVRHLEHMGIAAIPVAEGVRQFLRWIKSAPPAREVVVTASLGALPTWQRPAVISAPQRYTGERQVYEPNIELVTRVALDTSEHLYLADHNYRGSLLMPTVMGLEAMAEACLQLCGATDQEVLRIEDVRLERPIVAKPGIPTVIEIRALASERDAATDPRIVEASIHTEQSDWQVAHFAARFVIGPRIAPAQEHYTLPTTGILGIVPSQDLYGGVLFQGPIFQRISAIESLDERRVLFVTEARDYSESTPDGFTGHQKKPFVLGDPFYRDTLLQAAQLSLTPEVCLPIRIGQIERYASWSHSGRYRAEATIVGREGKRVTVELNVIDEHDRLVERITGYEVQVIEERTDFPTPAELVARGRASDAQWLSKELEIRAQAFSLVPPSVVARRIPNLHAKRREERRVTSLPVFHAALQQAGDRYALSTEHLEVQWLESGKPVFTPRRLHPTDAQCNQRGLIEPKVSALPIEVSLSHDGEWLLCVAGLGPQGCDLLAPLNRTGQQWQAMLGQAAFALVTQLEAAGETVDRAGGRVWSALEAAMKALDTRDLALEMEFRAETSVVFRASVPDIRLRILTFPIAMANDGEHMVAIVVGSSHQDDDAAQSSSSGAGESIEPVNIIETTPVADVCDASRLTDAHCWTNWLSSGGDPGDFFRIEARIAPPNEDSRILFRFPLAFKDGANPDGTLYFVRFFEWMGRLREMALRPVLPRLSRDFASGKFAWVTNRSWAQIERPVRSGEVLEVSSRFLGRGGPNNSMVALGFDWHQVTETDSLIQVATTQIEMTWASVLSHGVVSPAPYPDYLDRFFAEFATPVGAVPHGGAASYRDAIERIGAGIWRAKKGPTSGMVLSEQSVMTTTNDANLVGNIYYSKYYELQGQLRDSYFFNVIPDAYQLTGHHGGIRCIFTEVKHLRDAMPFDKLVARMLLIAIHDRGFELRFDFYRAVPGGKLEKLATGTHVAAWSEYATDAGQHRLAALPLSLKEHLHECTLHLAPPSGQQTIVA